MTGIEARTLAELTKDGRIRAYLEGLGLSEAPPHLTLAQYLAAFDEELQQDRGFDTDEIVATLRHLVESDTEGAQHVRSVAVLGGTAKNGDREPFDVTFEAGTVTAIVGPTGSGKSRLLADIEWMAQGDTPTGRRILINGAEPDERLRFSLEHRLVAQLTQNMGFVMNATVGRFVALHAKARRIETPETVAQIVAAANALAGESFSADTPLTSLSGGQSRALMIADVAFLSRSPIVLIDEIENAGIDRRRAMDLLVAKSKIVLIATHDPILALMADRRLTLANGAIATVTPTSSEDIRLRGELETHDEKLRRVREAMRKGETLGH